MEEKRIKRKYVANNYGLSDTELKTFSKKNASIRNKEHMIKLAKLGYDLESSLEILNLTINEVSRWTIKKTSFLSIYNAIAINSQIEIESLLLEKAQSGDRSSILELKKNRDIRRLEKVEKQNRAKKRSQKETGTAKLLSELKSQAKG